MPRSSKRTHAKEKAQVTRLKRYDQSRIPSPVFDILKRLRKGGHDALLVGGCVRDYLLGLPPKDFDIVSDALPEKIKKLLPRSRIIGRRFRLVHVHRHDGIYEVATYRREGSNAKRRIFRRPQIVPFQNSYGTQYEDAYRRDFTINALYFDPSNRRLFDYVGGLDDIENRIIRSIGPAHVRFTEDPVRILRAIRFAAKLGLDLDPEVSAAIEAIKPLLKEVKRARLRDELVKLLSTGHGTASVAVLREYDVLNFVLPLHEETRELLDQAMIESDLRVQSGRKVSVAYLLAVLLWRDYCHEIEHQRDVLSNDTSDHDLRMLAFLAVVDNAAQHIDIPKAMRRFILEIYSVQPRLERARYNKKLLERPRIRAGIHFLNLRATVGEVSYELVEFWRRYQPESRKRQTSKVRRSNRPRKRTARSHAKV